MFQKSMKIYFLAKLRTFNETTKISPTKFSCLMVYRYGALQQTELAHYLEILLVWKIFLKVAQKALLERFWIFNSNKCTQSGVY